MGATLSPAPAVLVVHTQKSPCLCHRTVLQALEGAGIPALLIDTDALPEKLEEHPGCRFAFDTTDTYRGGGDRYLVTEALEHAGIRVIGTPAAAGRVADDKILARAAFERIGLPVAPAGSGIGWPRVIKAPRWHGSRALRFARHAEEEEKAHAELLGEFGPPLLVEEFVPGKEIAVALMGGSPPEVFKPVEIQLPSSLYDFEDKWNDRNPRLSSASLPREVERSIIERLSQAHGALGLRDLTRFDLRVRGDGTWVALEVNVRPSLEPGGILELAASLEDRTLDEVLLALLAAAGGPGKQR